MYFPTPPDSTDIPAVMPSPFANIPHPLARHAALLLQQRLPIDHSWLRDHTASDVGKMFGVLVVRDQNGRIGFLSAFSGMICGQWQLPGFVPPIFQTSEQDAFLPAGKITLINMDKHLEILEKSPLREQCIQAIAALELQRDEDISTLKKQHKAAKAKRKQQRHALQDLAGTKVYQEQMATLALASQHHKRQAINRAAQWNEQLQHLQQQLDRIEQQIADSKSMRAATSRQLQQQVLASYRLQNYQHEQQPISQCFGNSLPPAGSGDCAGAKLIHYACQHQLQPLAMAEFWWGASPATVVRHHGHYYPACRGKCLPILPFMLRGIDVEPEPFYGMNIDSDEPQIVYEDEAIMVVNKPAGLISMPGKTIHDSVFSRLRHRYPNIPELKLMHRLDMDTSGLLLLAKNRQANRFLHKQFLQHQITKRYEAILSKCLPAEQQEGDIDLPLRVDLDDRPRQMVCYEHGKTATTHWQVIQRQAASSRVYFYPLTGRTHQLRVHAAHRHGLNAAIVGDSLYGIPDTRLMLHAQRLCFTHPVTRKPIQFEVPSPF